ncbi:MAG: DUF4190 domain-containing protein [Bifidobacteriaceae bacterium]|jgi:hypothetical protein|nr:DUF4190 domain-containing protein [Bifidobacteriaceae bacterium]
MSTAPDPSGNPNAQQPQFATPPPAAPPPAKKGLAIAALVLGILAIPPSFIPILSLLSWPLALLALIFGIIALAKAKRLGQGKGLAVAGLVLGAVALLGCGLSTWVLKTAVDDASDSLADLSGENTEQILQDEVTVELGEFTATEDEFGLVTSTLPVTITNRADEAAGYWVSIEAVDAAGTRIADDSVIVSDLAPGQSEQAEAFAFVTSDQVDALRAAEFKVYEVSKS